MALAGINWLGALMRLLPERDPHEAVYEVATLIADRLDDSALAPALVALFEAQVLAECGFRLDLSPLRRHRGDRKPGLRVAALGPGGEPRSGRAVARAAPAAARFPARGRRGRRARAPSEVADAFRTTGFFLLRDVFAPRGEPLPDSRRAFLAAAKLDLDGNVSV